jgi:hypothetical protein
MDQNELLWKRYELGVNTYTKYLDFALKLNFFYYSITGAMLSFYFAQEGNNTPLEHALLLPVIFGVGFVFLCFFSNSALKISKKEIEWLSEELKLNYFTRIEAVIYLVRGSAFFVLLTTFSILYVYFNCSL